MNRLGLVFVAAWLVALPAMAADVIGKVSRIRGDGEATSEGVRRTLAADAPVHLDEVVETGEGARLELTFDDGTVLTVGEKSHVTVDRFVYQPAGKANRLGIDVAGPFRYVSGKISKLGGGNVAVTTPFATIGIRGTDFWGGPIDGQSGVFLIVGRVVVSNAAGRAVLAQSGQGTNIAAPGAPPSKVTMWPADKVSRALSTVSF